jgi:putative redox protein
MKAKVVWQDEMAFQSHLDGFQFLIDADKAVGGQNRGPKPKGLTLVSLAGCTGMDVISILKKMRLRVDGFEVETDAVLTDEHPKKFTEITIRYIFRGKDLPESKLKKAVSLSQDRYCGVSATLEPVVKFRSEIIINEKKIPASGPVGPD